MRRRPKLAQHSLHDFMHGFRNRTRKSANQILDLTLRFFRALRRTRKTLLSDASKLVFFPKSHDPELF